MFRLPQPVEDRAIQLCGLELARMLSAQSDLTVAEAYAALGRVPLNMVDLLNHPEGWSALGVFVLRGLGCAGLPPMVTVH